MTSYHQCFIGFGLNKRNMSCTHKFYNTLSKFIRTIPLSLKKLPLSLSPYQGKMQYQLGIPWTCTPLGNCEEQLPSLTVGRLLFICRPTVGNLSADSWPTVDQHLTDSWPTDLFRFFWKDNFLQDICWPTVDRLSVDCRWSVGKVLAICR